MTNQSIRVRWSGGDRTFAPGDTVLIGRDVLSTVRLADDRVSRRHAELRPAADGWMLVDLGSTSGTFVGGQRVAELAIRTPMTVRFGGQTTVSDVMFEPVTETSTRAVTQNPTELAAPVVLEPTILPPPSAQRPGGALAPGAAAGATEIADASLQVQFSGQMRSASPGQTLRIGRDPGMDLSTENPTVSREHARISYVDGAWVLEDAGSTRGTFVDGRRITREAITGSMAFVLGPPETGERLIAVAAGADRPSRKSRNPRVAVILAVVACAIALLAVAGVVLTRGDGTTPAADLDQLRAATVLIEAGDGSGSGSIIDGHKGLILTAAHVAKPDAPGIGVQYGETATELPESPDEVLISLSQGEDEPAEPAFVGEVVVWDGYLDLAVVRIRETIGGRIIEEDEDLGLPEVPIGDSRDIDQGAELTVIGYPGIAETLSTTAEEGTISGFVQDRRLGDNRAWINSSVPIKRGHSGGLGADASGRLIAIPLMTSSDAVDTISRLRPVHLADELIRAAEDEDYVSEFVTPVDGEEIENVQLATNGPALATSCRSREADGRVSPDTLSIMFDYSGFPEGHQDLLVRVFAGGSEIGRVAAADRYPIEWGGSGCAAVTVPLRSTPEPDEEIAFFIDAGPNYEVPLFTGTLTA